MGTSTQPRRAGGYSAIYDAMPTGPMLTESDLALLWAALVALRESVPTEETSTQAQLARLLTALAEEQVRRHPRPHPSVPQEDSASAPLLPWGF
jgi:hypothetical protein